MQPLGRFSANNLICKLETFINASKNNLLTAEFIDEMENLGEAAQELETKLLLRSAVDVKQVEFQKMFTGMAKD